MLRLAQRADTGFDQHTFDQHTFDQHTFDQHTFDQHTFDQHTFGQALLGVDHTQDADFVIYGVGLHDLVALRNRLRSWGEVLASDTGTETGAPKNGCL